MRTLSANLTTETGNTITTPFYLIELGFSTVLRVSTKQAVTFDSSTFTQAGARVERMGYNAGLSSVATISLRNTDLGISAVVLGEGIHDKTAKIWKVYGTGSTIATADAVKIFDGVMDSVPAVGNRVIIECVSQGARTAFSPRLYCAPPVFNHLPPNGTIITINGDTYELERG